MPQLDDELARHIHQAVASIYVNRVATSVTSDMVRISFIDQGVLANGKTPVDAPRASVTMSHSTFLDATRHFVELSALIHSQVEKGKANA